MASMRLGLLLVLAVVFLGVSVVLADGTLLLAAIGASLTLATIWVGLFLGNRRKAENPEDVWNIVSALVQNDPDFCFGADREGGILFCNDAAKLAFDQFEKRIEDLLGIYFDEHIDFFPRMMNDVQRHDFASQSFEDNDETEEISVRKIANGAYLWKIKRRQKREPGANELPWELPAMRIQKPQKIVEMNAAMVSLVGSRPTTLDRLVSRLPLASGQSATLQTKGGPLDVTFAVVDKDDGIQGKNKLRFHSCSTPAHDREREDFDGQFTRSKVIGHK